MHMLRNGSSAATRREGREGRRDMIRPSTGPIALNAQLGHKLHGARDCVAVDAVGGRLVCAEGRRPRLCQRDEVAADRLDSALQHLGMFPGRRDRNRVAV